MGTGPQRLARGGVGVRPQRGRDAARHPAGAGGPGHAALAAAGVERGRRAAGDRAARLPAASDRPARHDDVPASTPPSSWRRCGSPAAPTPPRRAGGSRSRPTSWARSPPRCWPPTSSRAAWRSRGFVGMVLLRYLTLPDALQERFAIGEPWAILIYALFAHGVARLPRAAHRARPADVAHPHRIDRDAAAGPGVSGAARLHQHPAADDRARRRHRPQAEPRAGADPRPDRSVGGSPLPSQQHVFGLRVADRVDRRRPDAGSDRAGRRRVDVSTCSRIAARA